MGSIFKAKEPGINNVIGRSFLFAVMAVLLISILAALHFNNQSLQTVREDNLQKTHQVLSNVLTPAISIADITEVRRVLSLVSDTNSVFAVVDESGNVLLPDYTLLNLVDSVFKDKKRPSSDCSNIKNGYQMYHGYQYWITCTSLTDNDNDMNQKKVIGILLGFSRYPWVSFSSLMFYFMGVVILGLLLTILWFRSVLQNRLLKPLINLGDQIVEAAKSPLDTEICLLENANSPSEIKAIKNAFQNVLMNLQKEYKQRTESEKKIAMLDLAARVAHDIRSPLAVMEMSLKMIAKDEISKEKTTMLREAIQSLRDIANNLLDRYREPVFADNLNNEILLLNDDSNVERPILLYSLIDGIISQKRQEWHGKGCDLTFSADDKCKFLWLKIAPNDLKRTLSNILNNAFEALQDHKKIKVSIQMIENHCQISVCDSGSGIPADKIPLVLNGLSLKHSGKGLGLANAKKYMEKLNGNLELFSVQHKGTTVILTFSQTMNPVWFPHEIHFNKFSRVVIIDDDFAMRNLWINRVQKNPFLIEQFSNYDDAVRWFDINQDSKSETVFLVDYELGNHSINGLSFLTYWNIQKNGYLITSHAEEMSIQNAANNAGVWLIPKILANDIPIKF